jgi:hypothetical protein
VRRVIGVGHEHFVSLYQPSQPEQLRGAFEVNLGLVDVDGSIVVRSDGPSEERPYGPLVIGYITFFQIRRLIDKIENLVKKK